MIQRISAQKVFTPVFFPKQSPLSKKLRSEFSDEFINKGAEFITNIEIRKKRFGIKGKPQVAKLFELADGNSDTKNYFITKNGEKLLGEITFQINPNGIYIGNLEAMAKHQGIGSKLLQVAIERGLIEAPENKIMLKAHRLHVFQKSPVSFYEKMGFNPTGRQSNDGIEMVLYPLKNIKWLNKLENKPILN